MAVSTCTGVLKPLPPVYQKLVIKNLTIIRPPMLKIYYWDSFDITGLNKKLKSNKKEHEHFFDMPMRLIHSHPLKMIFWIQNLSAKPLELTLKRIQNCECVPLQTRVGFNQFRQLFHCPHRRLINISQEHLRMKPDEVLALSVTGYFYLYGAHALSFEVQTSDERQFLWHFKLEISAFDLEKCLVTKELLPVNIKHFQRVTQPIWVQNISMMNLAFSFATRDRGLKLHNSNLTVPRQSVWPLMAEYRPLDYENELEVTLIHDNAKICYKIKARGVLEDEAEISDMPLKDTECSEYLYVIYPNRLDFEICLKESRTQVVNVHNYGQKCMEFRWQNYIIHEFLSITFEPQVFRLKGHHSKLCQIKLTVHERLLHFRRIPLVLEVHNILDRTTQIAKAELAEIESIDDPKWMGDSYLEHVFLQMNIRTIVHAAKDIEKETIESVDTHAGGDATICAGGNTPNPNKDVEAGEELEPKTPEQLRDELIKRLSHKQKLTANEIIELSMAIDQRVTVFEKLFWKYLSKTNFMRITADRSRRKILKTYEMVVDPEASSPPAERTTTVDRNEIMEILGRLLFEGISDLAKNWVFIPSQYFERLR